MSATPDAPPFYGMTLRVPGCCVCPLTEQRVDGVYCASAQQRLPLPLPIVCPAMCPLRTGDVLAVISAQVGGAAGPGLA